MSEDMNEMDVNGEREEGAKQAPPDNPLTEDPRRADSGRDLARRIADVIDDLEWRQVARDRQATAISILEDIERSAADRRAEWKAANEKHAARVAPQSGAAAADVLGRLLLKCEDAMGDLLSRGDIERFAFAAQLANGAARLAGILDKVSAPAARPRKVRGKRP